MAERHDPWGGRRPGAQADGLLRTTLDALAEGVIFLGPDGSLLSHNAAAEAMFGALLHPEAPGPAEATDVVLVDETGRRIRPADWPAVRTRVTGEALVAQPVGVVARDGEIRWCEITTTPLGDAPPYAVVASMTDVTDRRRRARALHDANQQFRATFERAPIGMALLDADGGLTRVNDALSVLVGHPRRRLEGSDLLGLVDPSEHVAAAEALRGLFEGTGPGTWTAELPWRHAGGQTIWVHMETTAIHDADGLSTSAVTQVQDVTERRRHEAELRHLADHDALTGLPNRRGFARELDRHVEHVRHQGPHGAVLLLDLDHFKYVNDSQGHRAGDLVIVDAATALRARLRGADLVARLGGDEFAVLLAAGGRAQAVAVAESLLDALRGQSSVPAPGQLTPGRLTASIGVAVIGEEPATAEELLVHADLAMYDAKEEGRDRVAVFGPRGSAQPRIRQRLTWMDRIRAALAEDGFELHAQPICDLRSQDAPAMHELLLRMRTPSGDLVAPGRFLPVAERFGLIEQIDRWVVRQAVEHLGVARAAGLDLTLTVNVSGRSIGARSPLLADLREALAATGADPGRLIVEITETAAVAHVQEAREFADHLRGLGCRLAIDDFGAGFGSFYYLKHLPFDFLKIDGEFVLHARTSRPDELIVQAVRHMAHGLGREVIAEYCSDEPTLAYLRAQGIDFAQGFHLGRPRPVSDVLVSLGEAPRTPDVRSVRR